MIPRQTALRQTTFYSYIYAYSNGHMHAVIACIHVSMVIVVTQINLCGGVGVLMATTIVIHMLPCPLTTTTAIHKKNKILTYKNKTRY